jgi:hypothetical protein
VNIYTSEVEMLRARVKELEALCQEMLSELYVYRASEYLKDVTASIRAKNEEKNT